jgi:hypothetical protein
MFEADGHGSVNRPPQDGPGHGASHMRKRCCMPSLWDRSPPGHRPGVRSLEGRFSDVWFSRLGAGRDCAAVDEALTATRASRAPEGVVA